jgi:ABC-type transport system substrate-binding protein
MQWEGRPDEDPSLLFGATGPFNFAAYRSGQVAALLDSIRVANGPAGRAPLMAALGGLLASDQPLLFLYQFDVPALVATRLHGVAAVAGHLDLRHAWVAP